MTCLQWLMANRRVGYQMTWEGWRVLLYGSSIQFRIYCFSLFQADVFLSCTLVHSFLVSMQTQSFCEGRSFILRALISISCILELKLRLANTFTYVYIHTHIFLSIKLGPDCCLKHQELLGCHQKQWIGI